MKKNLYIGGYSILDLNDTNVYKQALICAEQNKPVLVYDDPLRYYADTISIDTDNDNNVVITKGGKTITITDANSVSSEGDIQPVEKHLYYTTINVTCEDDSFQCYFSIELNTTNKITTLTSAELIELLSDYSNVILFGYADYNENTFTELTFNIVNGAITEISFNNGGDSTNTITTFDTINVKSVQLF